MERAGAPLPLWPLPLLAGLLPAAATLAAYGLSRAADTVPECNPFVDGCVSISRAARHGLANIVFQALVMPAAVLQALCWMLCPGWLRSLRSPADRWQRALPVLGMLAAIALLAYVSVLGVEGEAYRWLRRLSVPLYFGLTCIVMLVVGQHAWRQVGGGVAAALLAPAAALPLLGLVHVLGPLVLSETGKDALENATEWWGGAIFTCFFLVLAWAWRRTGLALRISDFRKP